VQATPEKHGKLVEYGTHAVSSAQCAEWVSRFLVRWAYTAALLASGMLCDIPMSCLKASLVVQLVLALYFQAIVWFPLGAWNDQPGKRLIEVVQSGEAPLPRLVLAL
jgi:hypothetical protein